MARVDPGELNRVVTFIHLRRALNEAGYYVEEKTHTNVRAACRFVESKSGDADMGGSVREVNTLQIIIPWRGFVPDTGMEVIVEGVHFEVTEMEINPFGGMFRRLWAKSIRKEAGV